MYLVSWIFIISLLVQSQNFYVQECIPGMALGAHPYNSFSNTIYIKPIFVDTPLIYTVYTNRGGLKVVIQLQVTSYF